MNDDYLWDKSGEPDPQIQELEQILAPLRYQPKPFVMPRRNYAPLAIAATVLIALLVAGVWLQLRRQKSDQPQQEAKSVPSVPSVFKEEKTVVENTDSPKKPVRKRLNKKPIFTKHEHEEALAAKQQLMLALRLASEKLKWAQRRTQAPSQNQIKNQHRVG
jgi:negative regulator of sigma E activity